MVRCSGMPPTNRTRLLSTAPAVIAEAAPVNAPPVTVPVVDDQREDRLRLVLVMLSSSTPEKHIVRALMQQYAVTQAQAKVDYEDTIVALREQLSNEGAIDGVMWGALARASVMEDHFARLALEPLPEAGKLLTPSKGMEDSAYPHGDDAIYSPLSPAERATLIAAKAAAAKVAIALIEMRTKLAGRQSPKWADKPAVVIPLGGGTLKPEQEAELRRLGLLG